MIAALLLAGTCAVTSPNYGPTRVLTWDALDPASVAGYSLWYRFPGGTFQKLVDLPCWNVPPTGPVEARICRVGVPVQRYRDEELQTIEWAIDAYDALGRRSEALSDVVSICMADEWKPGESYQ